VLLLLQVVQNGLEILTYLADRMGHDFKPYISSIIQPTIDRLGKIIHPLASCPCNGRLENGETWNEKYAMRFPLLFTMTDNVDDW